MIRVLGANPAMDRTHIINTLELGEVNRVAETGTFAGGKGLDVARTVRYLGAEVAVYGFLGGHIGQSIRGACEAIGIEEKHTEIQGETRVCNIYVEPHVKRSTVVNEQGPYVTQQEQDELLNILLSDVTDGDFLIMTGSVPRGVPHHFYRQILEELSTRYIYTIVDATGNLLYEAMKAKPWLIKPNHKEFQQIYPQALSDSQLVEHIKGLVQCGISHVIVTLGEDGCLCATNEQCFYVRVPQIQPVNPIASGDAFTGGFVTEFVKTQHMQLSAQFGSACAVANALNTMPEIPKHTDLDRLMRSMKVEHVV